VEIQDQDVLMKSIALNDQIGVGIKEYHEFVSLGQPEVKKVEIEAPKKDETPTHEIEEIKTPIVQNDTAITNIETPKMPWEEEEDDDLVYSK
jgi:hypothetical protein